jgi:hypothetical protein
MSGEMLARMAAVEAVIHGVLKIRWNDGYEGVVDTRPLIARGEIFEYIRDPDNFAKVKLSKYGHTVHWFDLTGYEIDLGSDSLRRDAEKQAELHRLIAI